MPNDEYHNSTGYWKDPCNDRELAVEEPRVVTCKPGEPFTWPMIALADGNVVKLNSKLWNVDEKQCYKEYRSGGKSKNADTKQDKPTKYKNKNNIVAERKDNNGDVINNDSSKSLVKYDPESVSVEGTLETIAKCDKLYGVSIIAGMTYVLCGSRSSNVVHSIPRSLMPDSEFARLTEA